MRTALSPVLTPSRCDRHSLFSLFKSSAPAGLSFPFPHRVCRPFAAGPFPSPPPSSARAGSWTLNELPPKLSPPKWDLARLPEKSSPLIFHLEQTNPYINLAIEHYLLTRSHPSSRILLFYTNRPSVIIGRNQNPWLETDLRKLIHGIPRAAESRCPQDDHIPGRPQPVEFVRRRSGGGTVFHDLGNLNYSVIVPNNKFFNRNQHAEMVVRALNSLKSSNVLPQGTLNFADVRVNDRHDIVMRRTAHDSDWLKVSGSAYKITGKRALHHGTLLLASPYIGQISELLRSPGKTMIQAKGVESVRSPVGNLTTASDQDTRRQVRQAVTQAIADDFWALHADKEQRRPGWEEMRLGGGLTGMVEEISAGLRELQSRAWRFDQTPKFAFWSGVVDGWDLEFTANHGVMDGLTLRKNERIVLETGNKELGAKANLRTSGSWKDVLKLHSAAVEEEGGAVKVNEEVPAVLVERMEAVFPREQGKARSNKGEPASIDERKQLEGDACSDKGDEAHQAQGNTEGKIEVGQGG